MPASVHHLLLDRSDGTFQLVLWNEVSSFDLTKKVDVENPDVEGRLVLASPAASVTTTRLGENGPPVQRLVNVAQVDLKIPDEVNNVGVQPLKITPDTRRDDRHRRSVLAFETAARLTAPWGKAP